MPFLGRDFGAEPDYSDELAKEIDGEIRRLIEEAHTRAHDVLMEHIDQLHQLSGLLIERETIDKDQFERLLAGEPPDSIFPAPRSGGSTGEEADERDRAGTTRPAPTVQPRPFPQPGTP
jgi:cell division protease FtsH